RFIELRNGDDPVPMLKLSMLWKRPEWFPGTRPFTPVESFAQHGVDITTAITRGTGATIGTDGHEYRSVISNQAFARAVGLGRFGDEAVHTAATRAQDTALSEAKRVREMLTGAAKAAKPQ
ncbi:MAG: hypothetical protein JWM98_769, partial [Thermoleophilia bacterium]|nr:hypothetical protein [Thermoleophilia bacterium]